jgi:cellulose synthase/poly-beta-1,6-N-acetylglucosamine synthase-like glycosyltransferase
VVTLHEALESLANQTLSTFEIIAVDDGSTDATPRLLAEWAQRDGRIRVVFVEPRGIVHALNVAARHANGSLYARMDADDIAEPTRLERQAAYLAEHPDIAACGSRIRYFPCNQVRNGARRYERWINTVLSSDDIERDLFVECPIPHPTLVVRREVFERIEGYREVAWPEDYDFILRVWQAGCRLGKVPEVLLSWRERPDRLSRTHPRYADGAFRNCKIHFLESRIAGRPVVICGAGPVGKAFALGLQERGYSVAAFVDLDPRKIGQTIHGAPVIAPSDVGLHAGAYFLAAVGSSEARSEIRDYLAGAGFEEPKDFCAVA